MESLATNKVFFFNVGLAKVFVGKNMLCSVVRRFSLCLCVMLCIARHNMVKLKTLDRKYICVFMKCDLFGWKAYCFYGNVCFEMKILVTSEAQS